MKSGSRFKNNNKGKNNSTSIRFVHDHSLLNRDSEEVIFPTSKTHQKRKVSLLKNKKIQISQQDSNSHNI